ncbi:RHS repeat-associated core domain-containing protein [Ramlibacter sp.]|uniref:RHS repeat-associated core domain-containing protein n=1 Tax=Ramlibacter sp. TaxID=1917967 RepID=UPI003D0BA7BE
MNPGQTYETDAGAPAYSGWSGESGSGYGSSGEQGGGGSGWSFIGNPINAVTGEKVQTVVDWRDAGVHPLHFVRHYRSYGNPAWSHNWAASIAIEGTQAKVAFGSGRSVVFTRASATGAWVAQGSVRDTLTDVAGGVQYLNASNDSRWLFAADGRLQSVAQRNGWTSSLAYNTANQLVRITNALGRSLQLAYDSASRLTSVTASDGSSASYSYDAASRLVAVTYPGASRGYLYEDARWPQALTGVVDEGGQRLSTFAYDEQGRAVLTQHAGGAQSYTVSYSRAAGQRGALRGGSTVDPAIYQSTTTAITPSGGQQVMSWQGGHGATRLAATNGAFAGNSVAGRTFGTGLLIDTETDVLGVQTMYTWDVNRKLKLSTTRAANRPEAQTVQVQWHPTMRLPMLVTEAGRTTEHSYNEFGDRLSTTVRDTATGQSRTWSWTYNAQRLVDSMTDPRGGVWRYRYDAAGNLVGRTNPMGQESVTAFDAAGRIVAHTEAGQTTNRFTYDARGRVTSASRGDETTTFAYTPTGQLATATLPNGYFVMYRYDAAQRLVGAQDSYGTSVSFTLNAAGQRIRDEVKDGSGRIAMLTTRVFDTLGKLAALQGASGQNTQIGYDANGAPVSVTDPLNQTMRQTLDGLQRTTATTFADGAAATQSWKALDQLTRVTDPKGVATQYTTNAFGEVLAETSPDIGTLRYTRDAAGAVTSIEDAKGQITRIERDALGRATSITYADGAKTMFSFDPAGFVSEMQDGSGTTRYTRDAHGRILGKTQTVNDNPGKAGSQHKLGYAYTNGDLTTITYPSGLKVGYERSGGRITGITIQPAGKAKATFISELTHTALGQPRSWKWSNGAVASRSFDADGRMTANEFASYTYDAASRIVGITQKLKVAGPGHGHKHPHPPGHPHDPAAGPSPAPARGPGQEHAHGPGHEHAHSQEGVVSVSWVVDYDNRNRLTRFARPGAESRYTYDPNSNRLTGIETSGGEFDLDGNLDGAVQSRTDGRQFNIEQGSNRLLGFTQTQSSTNDRGKPGATSTTSVAYGIDANGSMTSDGLRGFEYDASGRLVKVKLVRNGEAASVAYLHNAQGQRVFKSEVRAEQTLPKKDDLGKGFVDWLLKNFGWLFEKPKQASLGDIFVYGDGPIPGWALLGEYDNGKGKEATEYIWLPTEDGSAIPVGMLRGGKFYAIHADHLGTPRLIADEKNRAVWQWPYSAFGQNEPTGVLEARDSKSKPAIRFTAPPVEVNLRLPGQYFDSEIRLFFNTLRNYDAGMGRYIQTDPLGWMGGANRFLYVGANPHGQIDPWGLMGQAPGGGPRVAGNSGSSCLRMDLQSPQVDSSGCISTGSGPALCLGPGAIRSVALTLAEQLALASATTGGGTRIMQGFIKDPAYPSELWAKMQAVHFDQQAGRNIVIHYWQNLQSGVREGFKFK